MKLSSKHSTSARRSVAGIAALLLAGALTACGPNAKTKDLIKRSASIFGTIPAKMPGGEKDTPARVALGKKLYFDVRLSVNDKQSCNSCHRLDGGRAGEDGLQVSPGALAGKKGDRNAPTVLNAGFHLAQFWDGRARNLTEQAKGPILNPVEMGMPSEAAVVAKLGATKEYPGLFKAAFPGQATPLTYQNLAEAIAAFERTQRTTDRFDDFQKGKASALTALEQRGLDLFMSTGCTACHKGPLLGGDMYQKMGLVAPYANKRDIGREAVTKKASDRFLFKVPSLRNVAVTAPYFHDGAVQTLEEAVTTMAAIQLGRKLPKGDAQAIAAFLKSLTGKGIRPSR